MTFYPWCSIYTHRSFSPSLVAYSLAFQPYSLMWLYLSLDHMLAVQLEVEDTAVQVDGSFGVQLLQNPIQGDEGPCTANTSTNTHTESALKSKSSHWREKLKIILAL